MRSATINLAACALALATGAAAVQAQEAPGSAQDPVAAGIAPAQPPATRRDPKPDIVAAQIAAGMAPVSAQAGQATTVTATGWQAYRRMSELVRPIDVNLRDATVQQAAQTLSKAAGINISADSSVPRDLRLTVEAQQVPLRSVLEGIANQANLMIGRDGDTITLKPWPSLNVNGRRSYYKGQYAPWGDEWGGRPDYYGPLRGGYIAPGSGGFGGMGASFGGGQGDGFGGGKGGGIGTNRGDLRGRDAQPGAGAAGVFGGSFVGGGTVGGFQGGLPGASPSGGFAGGGAAPGSPPVIQADGSVVYSDPRAGGAAPGYSAFGGMFSMTALGDKLVIAEPRVGPQGESGIVLTVYMWDASRQTLRRVSSLFHRAEGASSRSSGSAGAPRGRLNGAGADTPRPGAADPAVPGGIAPEDPGGPTPPAAEPRGGFGVPTPSSGDASPEAAPVDAGTFNMPVPDDTDEPL